MFKFYFSLHSLTAVIVLTRVIHVCQIYLYRCIPLMWLVTADRVQDRTVRATHTHGKTFVV